MALAIHDKTKELTEGPLLQALINLSGPVVLANVLQTAIQITTIFWVGRLGTNAVAAMSLSIPIIFLMISIGSGITIAGSTFVAQYAGARNTKMMSIVTAQTMNMVVIVSIVLSVLGYVIAPGFLHLLGTSEAIMPDALAYMRVTLYGIVFMFIFAVFQSVLRGVGEVNLPLYLIAASVVLNFVLTPFFMFGWGGFPKFGLAGSAWAMLVTQVLTAAIGLKVLFGKRYGITVALADFKPDLPFMKRTFLLGLPASIEQSARAFGLIIMTFLIASFGTLAVASYGVGARIMGFAFIPAMGLSLATATLVGQNVGAGNIARAEECGRLSAWLGFGVLTAFGLLVFLFASAIVAFFVPGETALIAESTQFVQVVALTYGFMGVQQAHIGALRGAGSMVSTMVLSIVGLWVLQFPIAYVFSKHTALGLDGIWWAYAVQNVLTALITWAWFARGKWKTIRLTEDERREEAVVEEVILDQGQP